MSSSTTFSSTATSTAAATASCVTVRPGKYGYVPESACNANYNYDPSFTAALIFAIIFGLSLILHIYQATLYKKWRLSWTIIMGVAWEFASFAAGTAGSRNQQSTPLAFASQLLVLLAPMWINAFDYMVLGRMIYFFIPNQKIWGVKGTKIATIFVWLDIVSFITQVIGGIMISPGASPNTIMTGIHVYMGGIGLQQFCILIFTALAIKFFMVVRQQDRNGQILDGRPSNWRLLSYALFASLALITTRIIYRLVEYSKGTDPSTNQLPFHEVYFLTLDALPMFIASILMNVIHPGRVLQGEGSELPHLTRRQKKEAKALKKSEKQAAKEEKKALKAGKKAGAKAASFDMV